MADDIQAVMTMLREQIARKERDLVKLRAALDALEPMVPLAPDPPNVAAVKPPSIRRGSPSELHRLGREVETCLVQYGPMPAAALCAKVNYWASSKSFGALMSRWATLGEHLVDVGNGRYDAKRDQADESTTDAPVLASVPERSTGAQEADQSTSPAPPRPFPVGVHRVIATEGQFECARCGFRRNDAKGFRGLDCEVA